MHGSNYWTCLLALFDIVKLQKYEQFPMFSFAQEFMIENTENEDSKEEQRL